MKNKFLAVMMMLLLIITATPVSAFAMENVKIDEVNFPDYTFRDFVKKYDIDGDQYLSAEEIAAVTDMDISLYTADMTGLEYFTSLTNLKIWSWILESVDLSKNTALTELNLSGCTVLTSIDLSKNTNLTKLTCVQNGLTSLDLSENTKLTEFSCLENYSLVNLDLSKNINLEMLEVYENNALISLDLSKNYALVQLMCDYNASLTNVIMEEHPFLDLIRFSGNKSLKSVDISGCSGLTELGCYRSPGLTSLKLGNIALKSLSILECGNLPELDISRNKELQYFRCIDNTNLTHLDTGKNYSLKNLICLNNISLKKLDFDVFPNLESLEYNEHENSTSLDVSGNPALKKLICKGNKLTQLNVKNNLALTELDCSNNSLTNLDIGNNSELSNLNCSNNLLDSLEVSGNPALVTLNCADNLLKKIDIGSCLTLSSFNCSYNALTDLDISRNIVLKVLECNSNSISSLNFSNNTALTSINCNYNFLTNLDFDNNKNLSDVDITGNKLTYLNLKKSIEFFSINSQVADVIPEKTADGWVIDMKKNIPPEYIREIRIMPESSEICKYDTATGIITINQDTLPDKLYYKFNGTSLPSSGLRVELNLREEDNNQNFVIMKEGAFKAFVNGAISVTTKYACGYAKLENEWGTMQVPLRYVAEVNDFKVDYYEDTGSVKVINPAGEYLLIQLGSKTVKKYSTSGELLSTAEAPTAFITKNGVCVGPLRFTCEALGMNVTYMEKTSGNFVVISSASQTSSEIENEIFLASNHGINS